MDQPQDKDVQILLRALGLAEQSGWGATPELPAAVAEPIRNTVQAMTESQTTADKAIAQLADQYRQLQMQAGRILSLFGNNAPCEVINRHAQAIDAYVQAAGDVFNQLTRQGFTVVQSLYNLQGEKTGEQQGPAPVKPAFFEPCKSGLSGAGFKDFRSSTQFGHMVVNLGVTTDNGLGVLPVVAWIAIALLAGGAVVSVTHTIVVNNPTAQLQQVTAQSLWMDNYLSCVERTMKTQNVDHDKADALCRGLTAPSQATTIDFNKLFLYGAIGLGIVGVAALLAYAFRAHQERQALPEYEPGSEEPEFEPVTAAEAAFYGYDLSAPMPALPAALAPAADDEDLEGAADPAYWRCPCL